MKMTESDYLIRETLKTLLKRNGLKYSDLAKHLGVSIGAVKQIFSKGQLTVHRLESMAQFLGLTFFEFMNVVSAHQYQPYKLSLEQEKMIAQSPMAFRLLLLLGAGLSFEKLNMIISEARKPIAKKALFILDKIGMIELQPGDRIRILQRGPYRLNPNGPLEKKYKAEYQKFIISHLSLNPTEDTLQKSFELYGTQESCKWMKEEISKLLEQLAARSRLEVQIKSEHELFPITGLFFMKPLDGWGQTLDKLNSN